MRATDEAIVLVGGLGTRLRPVLSGIPKPLAPVAGRPFIAYLLDRLAGGGLRRVILATGYLAEQIKGVVGSRWCGMDIRYSQEGMPLGTGGAVRLAASQLLGDSVHLVNGDTFLRFDRVELENAVRDRGLALGMALARVTDVGRYGAVKVDGGRVAAFQEKGLPGPGLINAGSYFLAPEGLAALPAEECYSFEERVLHPLAAAGRVAAMQNTSDFIDIGVPDDYARAQSMLGQGD